MAVNFRTEIHKYQYCLILSYNCLRCLTLRSNVVIPDGISRKVQTSSLGRTTKIVNVWCRESIHCTGVTAGVSRSSSASSDDMIGGRSYSKVGIDIEINRYFAIIETMNIKRNRTMDAWMDGRMVE